MKFRVYAFVALIPIALIAFYSMDSYESHETYFNQVFAQSEVKNKNFENAIVDSSSQSTNITPGNSPQKINNATNSTQSTNIIPGNSPQKINNATNSTQSTNIIPGNSPQKINNATNSTQSTNIIPGNSPQKINNATNSTQSTNIIPGNSPQKINNATNSTQSTNIIPGNSPQKINNATNSTQSTNIIPGNNTLGNFTENILPQPGIPIIKENKTSILKQSYLNENPKIHPALTQILENVNPKTIAKQFGATVDSDGLIVYVHLKENQNRPKDIEILSQDNNIIKSKLNLGQIRSLANSNAIEKITLPEFATFYGNLTSEGVEFSMADSFHAAGINGTGIKIGVIDDSFIIENQEISDNWVSLWNGTICADISCGFTDGDSHGTAVASIVVDMAPASELYLYAIDDSLDFAGAVQHAIDNDVDILTASLGFPNLWGDVWYRDGTSSVAQWVDWANGNGTLFTVAAGNQGSIHWTGDYNSTTKILTSALDEGEFKDDLENTFGITSVLNFNSSATGNLRACLPVIDDSGEYIARWNDTLPSDQDYDFFFYDSNMTDFVNGGAASQTGSVNDLPKENFSAITGEPGCLVVGSFNSTENHKFHIEVGSDGINNELDIPDDDPHRLGSIDTPADSFSSLAVGAVNFNSSPTNYSDDSLESFSSKGPTDDGRLKPEICGPDRTVTDQTVVTGGSSMFAGTSASTPHIAGAAALLLQQNSTLTVDDLKQTLIENARFDSDFSLDNLCGSDSGSLSLENLFQPSSTTVALYEFDSDVQDSSGNANHGTVTGTTSFATGVNASAFDFDGSTLITTANEANFDFDNADQFSLSFWIKTTQTGNAILASKQENGNNFRGYSVLLKDGVVRAQLLNDNSPSNKIDLTGTTTVNDGNWHHIALTYDGSLTLAGTKLYVDGSLETKTSTSNNLSGTILNDESLVLGSRGGGLFYDGHMDILGIYNTELTSGEITELASVAPSSTTVALYEFDSDVQDSSGNANHGTVTGTTSFATGVNASAFDFDGSTLITTANEANFDFDNADQFSLSFWIKTTQTGNAILASKQENGNNFRGYSVLLKDGVVRAQLLNDNSPSNKIDLTGTTTVNDGNWHHIALTYDGSLTLAGTKLYVDGSLETKTSTSNNLSGTILNDESLVLGSRGGGLFYDGHMDILGIYNTELTSGEITELASVAPSSTTVALYEFDSDVQDSSGNANHGTVTGTTSFATGVNASAFDFDGSTLITTANEANFDFDNADQFSLSFWIKTTQTGNAILASKQENGNNFRGYSVLLKDGVVRAQLLNDNSPSNKIDLTGTTTVNDGNWHHIALTYDGSLTLAGTKLYVDGSLETKTSTSNNLSGTILNDESLVLGSRGGGLFYDGHMDILGIYNTELTSGEITELASVAPSSTTVALYEFDSDVQDSSGNANHGTVTGTTSFATGVNASAFDFDGSTLITTANEANFDFDNADQFSLSFWIKTTQTGNAILASKQENGNNFRGYSVLLKDGVVRAQLLNDNSPSNKIDLTGTTTVNDGNWHHIALTYDGSLTLAGTKLYVDGSLETKTSTSNNLSGTILNDESLVLGSRGGGLFYDGHMDILGIYNTELTSGEITELASVAPSSTTVALYEFDSDVQDSSGNANHGTVTGTTSFATGVNASAFDFDGSTLITTANEANFDFDNADQFSLSFWIKTTQTGNAILASKQENGNNFRGYSVLLKDGVVRAQLLNDNSPSNKIDLTGTTTVNDGNWHHIALTYDGSLTLAGTKLYVDGSLETKTSTSNNLSGTILNDESLVLGSRGGGLFYDGHMDILGIYNTELTSGEITELASVAPSSTTVALYEFDSDVQDSSGNANHGTVTGTTSFATGVNASAFDFDGSTLITTANEANFDFDNADQFSLSFWIKTTQTGNAILASKQENGNNFRGYSVLLKDGVVRAQLLNDNSPSNKIDLTGTTTVNDGNWHHIALTYDGSLTLAGTKLYVDGSLETKTSTSNNLSGTILNDESLVLGSRGGGLFYDGHMDILGIYNTELTSGEITELASVAPSSTTVALYEFDSDVQDSSGNANHGTVTGTTSFATGVNASAFDFDGSTLITTANEANFDFDNADQFSLSFWIKTTQTGNAILASKQENGNNFRGYSVLLKDGVVRAQLLNDNSPSNKIDLTGTTTVNDGNWHHIALTYDGSLTLAGTKLYVDGSLETKTSTSNNLSGTILNDESLVLGSRGGGLFYDGHMDILGIYNTELTSGEITELASVAPSSTTVALYEFDSDVQDSSGNANHGTVTGTTSFATGVNASAFDFDGSTLITTANEANFDFDNADQFSLSFWIKTTQTGNAILASKQENGNNFRGYSVLLKDGVVRAQLLNDNSPSNKIDLTGTTTVNDGNWHHIALTYDGSLTLAGTKLYVDGSLETKTSTSNNLSGTILNDESLVLGSRGGGLFYDGHMDILGIYNTELTSGEIATLAS